MMRVLIMLLAGLLIGVNSKILTHPSNTIARVGDTVAFPCVTEVNNCTDIDWTKQEGVQASVVIFKSTAGMLNNERYPVERYSVSSVDGCNLRIRELKLSDSGLFCCSEAKGETEESRYFVLVVVESEKECQSGAVNNIAEGTAFVSSCSAKFNASLIKPSKIVLKSWSGTDQLRSVQSTDANDVELTVPRNATPPTIEFKCTVDLSVEKSLPDSHDKSSPSLQTCTLASLNVSYPVTEIICKSGNEIVKKVRKSETVQCVPNGYPLPTCECKLNKNGVIWSCSEFTIPETAVNEDTLTCTATNTISGKPSTANVSLTVTEGSSFSTGAIIGIVIAFLVIAAGGIFGVVYVFKKKKLGNKDRKSDLSSHPLNAAPQKPPRAPSTSNQDI